MILNQIRFFINRRLGRETVLSLSLLDQPIRVAVSTPRELKRLRKMHNERPLVEQIWARLAANDTIYDIGANVGLVSLLMVLAPAGRTCRLHCFEPEPANFRQLSRNIALNGLEGRVTPHAMALGPQVGQVDLHVVRNSAGEGCHSIAHADQATHSITVPMSTVDEMVRAGGAAPNVVKIDVEGAEGQVLAGMEQTIRRRGVRDIFMELHDKGDGDKMPNGETIHDWLVARGYRLAWQTERSREQHRHYRLTASATPSPA